ncbi:hypothetical protein [Sporosarcina sp.]|uniref:hypothetical protein n=1 Tax=Sporosarcina sp. TaxID=49982 RepID=UPI0026298309|nr:hypothetical protein [Sporosarcina sp.]
MSMTRKRIVILFIVVLLAFVLVRAFKKDLWKSNEALLQQEVVNIGDSPESVNLADVTPFKWDLVYSFDPYTSLDQIYETVGYKWDRISETVSEGMDQLVFMKDGKVVCYVYGYPANNGYGIHFTDGSRTGSSPASVLHAHDDLTFQVDRSNEYYYLMKN